MVRLTHSRCNLQLILRIHFSAVHLFFPFFFFLSLSPPSNSLSLPLIFSPLPPTHEFFLLACFHSFLPDAELCAPLILLPCIALLCIISIAADRETGGTYTLPHALVGSSYTYWMYACLHVDALMWSVRGKWVRRRDKGRRRKERWRDGGMEGKASEKHEMYCQFLLTLLRYYTPHMLSL